MAISGTASSFLRTLILLAILAVIVESIVTHYCQKEYTVKVPKRRKLCYRGYGRYCCWRWDYYHVYEKRINWRTCCEGYTGCYCHIPICYGSTGNRGCQNGGICLGPEDCYCRNGGSGNCPTGYCGSYVKDCFPGTCDTDFASGRCKCSSGHEGDNCEIVRDGPTFQSCSVKLVSEKDQQKTLFEANCGDETFQNFTVYSRERDFDLVMNWLTTYEYAADDLGLKAPGYLGTYSPGIVESKADITVKNKANEFEIKQSVKYWEWDKNTDRDDAINKPKVTNNNPDVFFDVTKAMKHLDYLEVDLYATTGGYKEIIQQRVNTPLVTIFTGQELSRKVKVIFDLEPPTHCSLNNSCAADDVGWPLYVDPDITADKVTILWSSWDDSDSGIGEFSYEVFAMGKDQNGQLSEKTPAVATGIWEAGVNIDPPTYTPDTTGMYSVILTVTDQAGNINQARRLFLYDPKGYLEQNADQPLYVRNAVAKTGFTWITTLQNSTTGTDMDVTWKGHFENKFYKDNDLLGEVAPFSTPFDDDDGNRTTKAITTNNGVQKFEYYVDVSAKKMLLTTSPPETGWIDNGSEDSVKVSVVRTSGDHVRIFVRATDVAQHTAVGSIDLQVDASAPELNTAGLGFQGNVDTLYPLPEFASTVNVNVVDFEGGISQIDYELYEVTTRQEETKIQTGQQEVHVEDKSSQCEVTGKCYCLESGSCYSNVQKIYLNNCWFMNRDVKNYRLKFSVANAANIVTSGAFDIPEADVSNLVGEGEYPPIPANLLIVAEGKLNEYSATLTWRFPQACYEIQATTLTYTISGKAKVESVAGGVEEKKLEGLCSATEYTVSAAIVYTDGGKSEPVTVTFTTLEGDSRCATGGLSAGEIAGIVIGLLILIALLVILGIILWRKCYKKKPLPYENRFSRFLPDSWQSPPPYPAAPPVVDPLAYDNKAYSLATAHHITEDVYTDESELAPRWQFDNARVRLGDFIHNPSASDPGRFADIRLATLSTKSGNRQVVAKMLTPNPRPHDIRLMQEKMEYFGNRSGLTLHRNVLNFIGALPRHESGPVLLFDFCEQGRLLDWLKKQHMNDDLEFHMSNFCIQTACGLEYLHDKDIVHKRLGARNVLLTEKDGILVSKITGFGPMREESTKKKMVPARWLAPEQMVEEGYERIYTKETDVWTYGILLWEIYNKGAGKPYNGIEVSELKSQIVNGYRMERPELCSDFIYESLMHPCWSYAPEDRPSSSHVYEQLRDHFEGPGGGQTGYYDENELAEEEDELYFDAASVKKGLY